MPAAVKRSRQPRPAAIFAALGDETRLALVRRLSADGPQSIAHLCRGASITRQAVTKHLRVLEGAGIACGKRSGRERVWELEAAPFGVARDWLEGISAQWDNALERLKAFVEN